MKYLVKDASGKTVLATLIPKNAYKCVKANPEYKLIIVPEER